MPDPATEIRRRLDALGKRRAAQEARDEEIAKEVKEVLREAYGIITVEEAAERLRMHRTTIYRVYKPHG